jgi:putative ATP-dependent endonuclease of OLD family
LINLDYVEEDVFSEEDADEDEIFREHGCFVGFYTLEVDMMDSGDEDVIDAFKTTYTELITGEYWSALKKIEGNVSKGRFAQRLVDHLTVGMIPDYISEGIQYIVDKVKGDE